MYSTSSPQYTVPWDHMKCEQKTRFTTNGGGGGNPRSSTSSSKLMLKVGEFVTLCSESIDIQSAKFSYLYTDNYAETRPSQQSHWYIYGMWVSLMRNL
jgi:hypothetical protein